MQDRWPYPTSQTMQRQTGRGKKIAPTTPAETPLVPDQNTSPDKPSVDTAAQPCVKPKPAA